MNEGETNMKLYIVFYVLVLQPIKKPSPNEIYTSLNQNTHTHTHTHTHTQTHTHTHTHTLREMPGADAGGCVSDVVYTTLFYLLKQTAGLAQAHQYNTI